MDPEDKKKIIVNPAGLARRRKKLQVHVTGAPPGGTHAHVRVKKAHPLRVAGTPPATLAHYREPPPYGVGDTIRDRYKLAEVIGEGGTGTVYKAEDLLLRMPVAIKVLASVFTHDPQAVNTLKEEARLAMQLSHKHIVRLHTLDIEGSRYFLVMEHVRGRTFRQILAQLGQLSLESTTQMVTVCSDALAYAHRHGILHNDLKPDNLLLTDDGILKIIDFGVSCLVGTRVDAELVMGTPAYMSPEQKRGDVLDERTDVYAFGMIVYELLTGGTRFPAEASAEEILAAKPADITGVPEAIRTVLEKATVERREDRWPSVSSFAAAFMEAAGPASREME